MAGLRRHYMCRSLRAGGLQRAASTQILSFRSFIASFGVVLISRPRLLQRAAAGAFFMSGSSQASRDRANRLPGIMFRLKEQLVPDASERYVK